MPAEPDQLIQFLPTATAPPPIPATKALPQWLKVMPTIRGEGRRDDPQIATVKTCAPFLDAMACGYAFTTECDVRFFMREPSVLDVEAAWGESIETQPASQYEGTPFANTLIVKFMNSWITKTPPGYSTLFVPLLNHFTMPFQILAGLVETDTFYMPVHFPAICMMTPGQRLFLPAGTPIVQAIPIRRESWQSKTAPCEKERLVTTAHSLKSNPHVYRDELWVKKDYR